MMFELKCVLFDLDGTLVDTAPDLIACLNDALSVHGFNRVNSDPLRPYISQGALAMIKHAKVTTNQKIQLEILDTMLSHYENNILRYGGFFDDIEKTLAWIEAQGLKWGIITNKQTRFSVPLINALHLESRLACMISGDTTPTSKPSSEPMLAACQQAQVSPEECVYIGDALHDIDAGKSVNMKTLAAVYGYITHEDQPKKWGADALIYSPNEIKPWLEHILCN